MTEETQAPDSISLSDLQLLAQIVDLATSRGAFRGAELSTIGAIFDKLTAFLAFVQQQQEAAAEEAAQGEQPADAGANETIKE